MRTVKDLRTALRSSSKVWTFPSCDELAAWETILCHAGRKTGEDLTTQSLRRLEVLVSDKLGIRIYDLGPKPLQEFADLCDQAAGVPRAYPRRRRGKLGRPIDADAARDRELPEDLSEQEHGAAVGPARSGSERPTEPGGRETLAPLSEVLRSVWDALDGYALTAKEIAVAIRLEARDEDLIRKRIGAIRRTGRQIENRRGLGYYRPDAPPAG